MSAPTVEAVVREFKLVEDAHADADDYHGLPAAAISAAFPRLPGGWRTLRPILNEACDRGLLTRVRRRGSVECYRSIGC